MARATQELQAGLEGLGWNRDRSVLVASLETRQERVCLQLGRCRFDSWAGKIPWRREWQHRSITARLIPCTEEPGGLQSMELQRVGYSVPTGFVMVNVVYPGIEAFFPLEVLLQRLAVDKGGW